MKRSLRTQVKGPMHKAMFCTARTGRSRWCTLLRAPEICGRSVLGPAPGRCLAPSQPAEAARLRPLKARLVRLTEVAVGPCRSPAWEQRGRRAGAVPDVFAWRRGRRCRRARVVAASLPGRPCCCPTWSAGASPHARQRDNAASITSFASRRERLALRGVGAQRLCTVERKWAPPGRPGEADWAVVATRRRVVDTLSQTHGAVLPA
jgi:hypothetical protein